MPSPGPLNAGELVHDRYRVERQLGQGAFGATYLVRDEERFGTLCALKELHPRDESIVAKARELFEREARVLLAIEHQRVPTMHAYFVEEDRYYLVQKLVEGQALDDVLRRSGPLSEEAVRRLVEEVLEVLNYLHRRDPPVLHRDIKPSNLIRDAEGRIHVIDFGAVREALDPEGTSAAATTIGTPGYASLEQALGQPVPSSDLHALGMTALHLLTGRGPGEWRDRITGSATVLGRTGASPDFEQFLARLVADIPQRIRSAQQALQELQGEETVLAPLPPVPAPEPTRIEARPPARSEPVRSAPRSGRRWALAGAVVVLSALGVWVVLNGEDDNPAVAEKSAAPAEVLDREVTLSTPSRLDLTVRHPATWQLITTSADGHIGLRDGKTQSVFVTGLDASRDSVLQFARAWAQRMSRKHGQIALNDEGTYDQAGSFWRFRLTVSRSTTPEQGLLVVEEPPPADGETLYRWWSLLGQVDETIPTALAMANSLAVRPSPGQ
ncbi:MAG: serine/threonine protein kinase [Longimicrobiales bacterium]